MGVVRNKCSDGSKGKIFKYCGLGYSILPVLRLIYSSRNSSQCCVNTQRKTLFQLIFRWRICCNKDSIIKAIKILVYLVESRTWNGEKKANKALDLFQICVSHPLISILHGCSFSTHILQIVLFIQVFFSLNFLSC